MKLFIFEPCKNWDYCGGVVMVLAESLSKAIEAYHTDVRNKWIINEKHLIKTITHDGKEKMELELNKVINSDLSYFVSTVKEKLIGKENKNRVGHYWKLFDSFDVKTTNFKDGSTIYENYNYS